VETVPHLLFSMPKWVSKPFKWLKEQIGSAWDSFTDSVKKGISGVAEEVLGGTVKLLSGLVTFIINMLKSIILWVEHLILSAFNSHPVLFPVGVAIFIVVVLIIIAWWKEMLDILPFV